MSMRWKHTATLAAVVVAVLTAPLQVQARDQAVPVVASTSLILAGAPIGAAIASASIAPAQVSAAVQARASVWKRVVTDRFNTSKVPGHWFQYSGPYGSGPKNCASAANVFTKGGSLRLLMSYRKTGNCGPGWYTGGMMIDTKYGAVDQRVTLRFRVIRKGVASHFIIPMRWPTKTSWPQGGEEDYCETDSVKSCSTFLHYSSANKQVDRTHRFDLSKWHTLRVQRLNHVVKVYLDDMTKPIWTYSGSSSTVPDTFKRVVLQQECQSSCPSSHTGTEEIQVDWITIDSRR
jgi:hypothetical protein